MQIPYQASQDAAFASGKNGNGKAGLLHAITAMQPYQGKSLEVRHSHNRMGTLLLAIVMTRAACCYTKRKEKGRVADWHVCFPA